MSLVEHAKAEMRAAGLYTEDADYGGLIPKSMEALIALFASQGHSGCSADLVIDLFARLARFESLTPLTNDPSEWRETDSVNTMWQSTRNSEAFSHDGGVTHYLLSDYHTVITSAPAYAR